jgi:anti-sigma factor RsiW
MTMDLHRLFDGEVNLTSEHQIQAHLCTCASCASQYQRLRSTRNWIHSSAPYYQVPADLAEKVQNALKHQEHVQAGARLVFWRRLAAAAVLMLVAIVAWAFILHPWQKAPNPPLALSDQVTASYVRFVTGISPTQFVSTDPQAIQVWMDAQLSYSINPGDYASEGFALTGARLDFIENQKVGVLIYRHANHDINLFVWPSGTGMDLCVDTFTQRGYNSVSFVTSGMKYWAISDLDAKSVENLVPLVQTNEANKK